MKIINTIKKLRHKAYIKWYSLKPLKENKIIMWANSFKQYGCSPKYITEYLLKYYPDKYDIVWVFEPQVHIPDGLDKRVRIVRYFSMEYLYELHTAKFVICNMRTNDSYYWHKRKGQVYIQTWHSSVRLKKIEKDAQQCFDEKYIDSAKKDSERIDLLLSGCDFSTSIFKRAFWYNGEILKSGTPRCDVLFENNKDLKNKIYDKYNIGHNNKIVLYAPTFRKGNSAELHDLDFSRLSIELKKAFGGAWKILYRMHPNILSECISDYSEAINVSKYPDMQELMTAAEILITDYSSCMFDMAIAGKKCILYAPDYLEYIKDDRGLYFDFEELPFPLADSNDTLASVIEHFDEEVYEKNIKGFLRKIGTYESGDASRQIAEYIKRNSNG